MLFGDDNKEETILGLSNETAKKVGIGLLIGGVAIGGYAIYRNMNKKKSKGATGKLSGTRKKRLGSGKKSKSKKRAKFMLKGF